MKNTDSNTGENMITKATVHSNNGSYMHYKLLKMMYHHPLINVKKKKTPFILCNIKGKHNGNEKSMLNYKICISFNRPIFALL